MKIPASQVENYLGKISQEKISGCLLYGTESTIARYRFDLIAKKIVENINDPFLVTSLSAERIKDDKALLSDEFYSMSMIGGRRLILVKDGNEDTYQALKILMSDPQYGRKSNNFILMLAGDLAKNSGLRKIVEDSQFLMALPCYEDKAQSIKEFIINELQKRNISYEPAVLGLMVKHFGKDRHLLINEANKIQDYLAKGAKLSLENFYKICATNQDENLYEFAIKFANKNYEWCLICAQKALENGNETIMLTRSLINYFSKLYFAKISLENEGKTLDEITKSAQIFYKIEDDFKSNLKNLSLKFIIKSLQSFENLEIKLKKGDMPQNLVFLSYITSYIVKKNSKNPN